MARQLFGFIRGSGKDYEVIGSDEFLRPTDRSINLILGDDDPEQRLPVEPFRWGGECRMEAHLNAIVAHDGMVQVYGHTSFFEGTSEDTPHERDREIVNFFVPRTTTSFSNPTVVSLHMQNDGDYGNLLISLQNSIVEDE